jgi:AmiR/NasT family two-component response regulator
MKTERGVVIADDDRDTREYLQEAMSRLGWRVLAAAGSGRELVSACQEHFPDLVITDVRMPDMDGITAAAAGTNGRPVPVIVISAHHDPELMARLNETAILGYLVKPFTEPHLKAAVAVALARFEQFEAMRREATDLRQALEDRKAIERAKGALMRRLGVSEDEAYRMLRASASNRNIKLVEAARRVITAEEVFAGFEVG